MDHITIPPTRPQRRRPRRPVQAPKPPGPGGVRGGMRPPVLMMGPARYVPFRQGSAVRTRIGSGRGTSCTPQANPRRGRTAGSPYEFSTVSRWHPRLAFCSGSYVYASPPARPSCQRRPRAGGGAGPGAVGTCPEVVPRRDRAEGDGGRRVRGAGPRGPHRGVGVDRRGPGTAPARAALGAVGRGRPDRPVRAGRRTAGVRPRSAGFGALDARDRPDRRGFGSGAHRQRRPDRRAGRAGPSAGRVGHGRRELAARGPPRIAKGGSSQAPGDRASGPASWTSTCPRAGSPRDPPGLRRGPTAAGRPAPDGPSSAPPAASELRLLVDAPRRGRSPTTPRPRLLGSRGRRGSKSTSRTRAGCSTGRSQAARAPRDSCSSRSTPAWTSWA